LAWGQALAQDITIGPQLHAGDTFRLEITRIRENSARPQESGKGRTPVNIRVVSVTPEGVVLDWIPGETVLDNPAAAQDPLLVAASVAMRGIVFRLNLNAEGEFTGIANQTEVTPKLQAMLDTIVEGLSARLPAEQRKPFRTTIAQLLTPAAVMSSATREAEIYFALNGAVLAAGETVEADLELPSPVGGSTIPARFVVELVSATGSSASLKTTTTYDTEALRQMTQALAQQAGALLSPAELAKIPPMQMADDGTYVFDRTVGLMREVTVNRTVSAANVRRFDGWQIRLVEAPKR
jgi:hypothetical protein